MQTFYFEEFEVEKDGVAVI